MPTNEERREVAENLRYMCAYGGRYKEQFYDLLVETVMGCEDFHDFADTACRLADLIEPEERTCRIVMVSPGEWECDACGGGIDWDSYDEGDPPNCNYCPDCGAKVVDAE